MLPLAIQWNIDPVIFHLGSFGLRWYSLGFLFSFFFGYLILYKMFQKEKVDIKYLDSFVIYMFLAVLAGARLGHCLFYEPGYFLTSDHWLEIFLPINIKTGQFTGYQGLASHGAALAILFVLWLFQKQQKVNAWWLVDRLVIVIALGGAFIRLGNLMNSEIYGVETSLPWGFIFERNGEVVPKHPTQLYESFSYFIIFGVSIFAYYKRKGNLRTGVLFGWWLIALFGMRLIIEFVKEEQVAFEQGMTLDMGQLLSLPFIVLGVIMLVIGYKGKLPDAPMIQKN